MVNNELLFHEIQLDNKLAKSVSQTRRADFALMLAMLSTDVREQSQFHLFETEPDTVEESNYYWRKMFNLPQAARLAVNDVSDLSEFNQSNDAHCSFDNIRLRQAMRPMPFAIEDNYKKIPEDVIANTTSDVQLRTKANFSKDMTINEKQDFNVAAWMDSIAGSAQFA